MAARNDYRLETLQDELTDMAVVALQGTRKPMRDLGLQQSSHNNWITVHAGYGKTPVHTQGWH